MGKESFLSSYYFLVGVVVFTILVNWFGLFDLMKIFEPDMVTAATSSAVTVTASISTSISCSTDNSSTAFGALDSSSITTSTPNASTTMTCSNSSAGCTLSVRDTGSSTLGGGLWNSTSSVLIESPNAAFNATATLTANTEGYGIRATTTSVGSGGTLTITTRYNTGLANGLSSNIAAVGGLTTSTVTLASSTSAVTSREIVMTHKAAVSSTTPGGTYDDTITYSCTAN